MMIFTIMSVKLEDREMWQQLQRNRHFLETQQLRLGLTSRPRTSTDKNHFLFPIGIATAFSH